MYNMANGRTFGFTALDWNDNVPPRKKNKGGRFDATRVERFKWLYGAEDCSHAEVAILETLSSFVYMDPTRNFQKVIQRAKVNEFALQYFKLSDQAILAELRTPEGRAALNAPDEVTFHKNRIRTREWGRYFRAASLDIQGLAYNSWRTAYGQRKASFILYEDRLRGLQFFADSKLHPLSTGKGRDYVNRVMTRREVLIQ